MSYACRAHGLAPGNLSTEDLTPAPQTSVCVDPWSSSDGAAGQAARADCRLGRVRCRHDILPSRRTAPREAGDGGHLDQAGVPFLVMLAEQVRRRLHERERRVVVVGENDRHVSRRGVVADERHAAGEAVVADPSRAGEAIANLEAIPVLGSERLRALSDRSRDLPTASSASRLREHVRLTGTRYQANGCLPASAHMLHATCHRPRAISPES